MLAVVNQRMAGRIRLISIEQGLDPRDFAMVAFGGAGPMHGAALIREVGIRTELVPPYPGVLCAMGCAIADIRYDYSQTFEQRLDRADIGADSRGARAQRAEGEAQLRKADAPHRRSRSRISPTWRMPDRSTRCACRIEAGWNAQQLARGLRRDRIAAEFGNTLGDIPAVIVNLRTRVVGKRGGMARRARATCKRGARHGRSSAARSTSADGTMRRSTLASDLLPGMHFDGPAIVEQDDTTTVVEPGMVTRVDAWGNLLVEVQMIDPVTLAVVRGSLEQIADEMDLHLIHAAISPIISETNDCAHGIFQPETGETIAQGRYGLPVFLANMQFTTQNVVKLAKAQGGFKPGDMWVLNDPYVGGTHLQDAQLVAPYFVGDKLFALFGEHRALDGRRRQRPRRLGTEGAGHPPGRHGDSPGQALRRRQPQRSTGRDVSRQQRGCPTRSPATCRP